MPTLTDFNLVFPVPYLSAGANYKGNSRHVIIHPIIICKKTQTDALLHPNRDFLGNKSGDGLGIEVELTRNMLHTEVTCVQIHTIPNKARAVNMLHTEVT